MSGTILMVLVFILIISIAVALIWYNKKYNKKISVGTVLIVLFLLIGGTFFALIKNMSAQEKGGIVKNVALKNIVVEIITDTHKQYFKDMRLDDGQILPMPESMNVVLQPGDSIYKNKGENFYTVVNSISKARKNFEVKVHERVLSKPQ